MTPFRTLAGRILFLFLGLFMAVQVVSFVGIDRARMQSARALIAEELVAGGASFDRQLQARTERFFLAARVLSGDLGFKKAFGSRHQPTLLSAMRNNAERLGAGAMLVVSLDRKVVADLEHPEAAAAPFPYPGLIEAAERDGSASGLVMLDNRLCQLVVFPLLAPSPAAWICIGYCLDDALARELEQLTALEVTFMLEGAGEQDRISATSLDDAGREALVPALAGAAAGPAGTLTFALDGERHQGLARTLDVQGGVRASAFLQRSLDRALEPFCRVRRVQLLVFAGGFAALFAGGVLVSATATTQLRRLAAGAKSVENGDYSQPLPAGGRDEIGQLSNAFNLMAEAIARREERIRHQAFHDELTGLPNRAAFVQRLEEALDEARTRECVFALVVMNIDRFVNVISALGYESGNAILRAVGKVLDAAVPRGGIVARLHADVFAMLVRDGVDVDEALGAVKRIQHRLEKPFWVDEVPVQVEGRFGIVACPAHGEDPDTLLRRADVAVHLARRSATGFAVYAPGHDSDHRRQLMLLGELRRAVDRNELTMHFQPKVHFASGRVVGLEALLRWNHARHGFIPPDEFIGLSEGTGLIKPVTAWALDAAIGECAALNRQGLPLGMAVNLSARSLSDHQLPALVASLVERHGVPAEQITLELTESAFMADPKATMDVVSDLDATGVRLAVDDFGTGYSSLSYLQRLPVDELKIDKSFVLNMDTQENDAMIVRTIIELGHNLGFEVTAEGVETRATWEILRANGCDLAQGYLHAKAMPMAELLLWAETSPWGLGARG